MVEKALSPTMGEAGYYSFVIECKRCGRQTNLAYEIEINGKIRLLPFCGKECAERY